MKAGSMGQGAGCEAQLRVTPRKLCVTPWLRKKYD
jgi:hypothetical protein